MAKIQSVEPNVADLANGWLKSYKLDYKLEQESLNTEIDQALNDYYSKNGGVGGNRPDAKLLLQDKNLGNYPILIEYKGYKDKLDVDGKVANKTSKNQPDFKNINSYAVNGAVHYANALLHYTSYTDIIAIGMTGYKNDAGKLEYEIGVYYVSKSNFGIGQNVDEYTDFSFLKKSNFDSFIEKVKRLRLSQEEIEKLREHREQEINASLVKLNNDIYNNEKGLSERDRVYLVAASIIATLGVPGKVAALEKSELKSSTEEGNRDGDIILRKIKAFLSEKNLPQEKRDLIVRTLQNTLTTDNINKVENGESQLKRVFTKIIDDLGIYYKIGLSTDFTGKLFNEMYSWLGFSQDKLNDVVLTPSYVATLLARLARVNKDSYVWDFATGSAGLLVASMNEMLIDAKEKIKSPDAFALKSAEIKANQLLGLEILSEVYMLAILNMILMGDGSSNILNKDSLKEFDGHYGFDKTDKKFPADAFVLNPPYSAPGNGMVFVEKALSMMSKGYAAIIIQNSAGSGKATEYNKKILKHSTLLASIKMPIDLFIGKSSVQTNIYVFRVGEAHQKDDTVKFIDFSFDGYTRTNRKKASCNLRDTDHAKERYAELVDLVRFGNGKLHYYTEKEYYEGNIDPENGADWNQTVPVDTKPTLDDFKKTVRDYLAWEVSSIIKNQESEDVRLGK
jgi:Type I restriction-modification system methyltransferase subunit